MNPIGQNFPVICLHLETTTNIEDDLIHTFSLLSLYLKKPWWHDELAMNPMKQKQGKNDKSKGKQGVMERWSILGAVEMWRLVPNQG